MPDLFSGDFIINVQGATNNSLGQGGQGVCGVHVTWDHTAICDISISLTSPSGQTITLVGPIGQFCTNMGNTGTTWDVTFLPCGGSAVPDPGFTAQWHSNQPWGSNNNYSGSYYPFAGCLENFSGPVNGNWILNVTDGQANDVGNLLNFEVIFCDPSGINCVLCEADAGDLTQGDVIECEGSNNLALDLMPTYIPPATPPPASDYSYAYVIGGLGGVIQAITSNPDMSSYAPGNYTVCGLSYYNGHQNLLPMPNGSLTVTQLANQLASSSPPFCGDMTSNCVNVTILANPPDTDEYAEICAPDCYDFLGQFYCQTGDYAVPQTDANGCPYNAILHLTVNQPSFVTVTEVICPGECSNNPNFPGACFPGSYTVVLQNSAGCDSTITLNLSSITVLANIQTPDTITCSQNTVPLSGAGSTSGIYTWTASNGGQLIGPTNQINATAGAAGSYQFRVCRTLGGITCCDSTSVLVVSDINLPSVPVVIGLNAICVDSIQT
ncbi:MAG: proprotein convertase P-domain-containing protein [Saprospiraceae bacterium]|nr:proprotein convertase P-domain-containing protein [Saprospiraceae bacterium]